MVVGLIRAQLACILRKALGNSLPFSPSLCVHLSLPLTHSSCACVYVCMYMCVCARMCVRVCLYLTVCLSDRFHFHIRLLGFI